MFSPDGLYERFVTEEFNCEVTITRTINLDKNFNFLQAHGDETERFPRMGVHCSLSATLFEPF
jgi:hypothetical protein